MTIRPCNEFIDCECSDNPFINTSAEAPDPNLFFARRYFPNIPSLNENDSWYERSSCLGTCFSEISQQDAEDCSLRNAQLCTWNPVQPPLTFLSDDPTSVPRSNIFGNAATSCSTPCPTGPDFVFTVPANTFYALTQQEANALAQSVCEYRALVFRMCQNIPPEPPVCDVTITSVMPPSMCVDAAVGESAAFGVTFDYTGMTNPTFLWLKDGIPLTQTQNPSLTISPVLPFDEGVYQLAIMVPHCPTVLSPPITLSVSDHVAVPANFDISAEQNWEEFTAYGGAFFGDTASQPWTEFVSSLGFCNPTGLFEFSWPNMADHPPGQYHISYVQGFWLTNAPPPCAPATPDKGTVVLTAIWDDNFNYDTPNPCDSFQSLVNGMRQEPFNGPGLGTGFTDCGNGIGDLQSRFDTFFNTPGAQIRWVDNLNSGSTHDNDGGDLRYVIDGNSTDLTGIASPGPGLDPIWQVIQINGLNPMPRKLKITDYNSIKSQFSDQAAMNAWNGQLNTRSTYTSTMVFWQDPPAGAFGGAQATYITNHPTAPGGRGWKLEIFNAALVPIWTGLKGFGETGIGVYTRNSASGPGCVALEDSSDQIWNPNDL